MYQSFYPDFNHDKKKKISHKKRCEGIHKTFETKTVFCVFMFFNMDLSCVDFHTIKPKRKYLKINSLSMILLYILISFLVKYT